MGAMTPPVGGGPDPIAASSPDGLLSRREAVRRLCLLTIGATASTTLISACDSRRPHGQIDAAEFHWPNGLVSLWDFQGDSVGSNTVTARTGSQTSVLTARGTKTVLKDSGDPGPFGPSLLLDGETVFVKDGDIGALDVSKSGSQVTVIDWVNDTADNHDDKQNGMAFRAGSHCEDGVEPARQYGSYFDGIFYLGWSWGHYTPHIGAQDGPSPGYPWNRDYAASARKLFTGVGQGRWHMEAFTYDGDKIVAYVDGLSDMWKDVVEPEPNVPGFTLRQTVDRNPYPLGKPVNGSPTTKRFSIGAAIYGTAPFPGCNFTKGKLGGVAVFNRALTAEEIMHIRLGTLRPGESITTYAFEVTTVGPRPLKEIGWTAKAGPNCIDVSTDYDADYRVSRPDGATKAFLRKTSTNIGATWVPLTGLNNTQVKRVRFSLASRNPAAGAQRILVQVGDKWWASDSDYTSKTAQQQVPDWAVADTATHVLSWEKGQWRPVTIQDGQELSIADGTNSDPIPQAPLKAIGFLSAGGDGSEARLTDFELLAD